MKGFEVDFILRQLENKIYDFDTKTLYQKEWIQVYREALRVVRNLLSENRFNELGGFYAGDPLINTIEQALGIKLVSWQKDYISNKSNDVPITRGCGKTFAYQLRIMLNPSLCLNLADPQDLKRMTDDPWSSYTMTLGVDKFLNTHKKLTDAGVPVCKIIEK